LPALLHNVALLNQVLCHILIPRCNKNGAALAVEKVLAQQFPNDLRSSGLALAVAVSLATKKKVSVVNVVQHKQLPLPAIAKPVVH
jgi:hypothetical protein